MSGWQDRTTLPLSMLGEDAQARLRHASRRASGPRSTGAMDRHSKEDRHRYAMWWALADALRRFVAPPFNGPWTE